MSQVSAAFVMEKISDIRALLVKQMQITSDAMYRVTKGKVVEKVMHFGI